MAVTAMRAAPVSAGWRLTPMRGTNGIGEASVCRGMLWVGTGLHRNPCFYF